MRISVNGTPHQVDFQHWRYNPGGNQTSCCFDAIPEPRGVVRWTSWAECSPNDTFRKATGRKVALARALKAKGYHKAWRTAFWAAYFQQAKP